VEGELVGTAVGSGDGSGKGTAVGKGVGVIVGKGDIDGIGVGSGHEVPKRLPREISNPDVTCDEREDTSKGTSPQNVLLFKVKSCVSLVNRPSSDGTNPLNEL
jgi:hypothetical protein